MKLESGEEICFILFDERNLEKRTKRLYSLLSVVHALQSCYHGKLKLIIYIEHRIHKTYKRVFFFFLNLSFISKKGLAKVCLVKSKESITQLAFFLPFFDSHFLWLPLPTSLIPSGFAFALYLLPHNPPRPYALAMLVFVFLKYFITSVCNEQTKREQNRSHQGVLVLAPGFNYAIRMRRLDDIISEVTWETGAYCASIGLHVLFGYAHAGF